jgi:mono/diheme cytochrome c family protein
MEEWVVKEWQRATQWVVMIGIGLSLGCSDDGTNERAAAPQRPPASASSTTESTPPSPDPAPAPSPAVEETRSEAELVEAGRGVYNANCIACHNLDATKDGALGPAVSGASRELLEARIVRAEYPPGYTPKRDTRVMIALRHLEPNLDELTAYLDSLD